LRAICFIHSPPGFRASPTTSTNLFGPPGSLPHEQQLLSFKQQASHPRPQKPRETAIVYVLNRRHAYCL
jgi:hypothetical protein